MCIPKKLEQCPPSPVKSFGDVTGKNDATAATIAICDSTQYEADIAAVMGGYISKPVTKAARLGVS